MSTFEQIIKDKYEQLDEAVPAAPAQGTAMGTPQGTQQGGQPVMQNAVPGQQQAPPEGTTQGPEQSFLSTLQTLNYKSPAEGVQQLNAAYKNAGQVPGMQEFWGQIGYEPGKGFVVVNSQQQQQAPQYQTQQTTPPGATATNTAPYQRTNQYQQG